MILPACLVILVAGMTALLLPSIYRSSSTILIEDKKIHDDFVTPAVTTYVLQRLQAINYRVMSYTRLSAIIEQFNLYPELKKKLPNDKIAKKMREDIKFEPNSIETIDYRTGRISQATISFTLSFEGKDPQTVQKIASILASLFLEENIKFRSQQSLEAIKFLEEEMNRVKNHLTTIEAKIALFKKKHINELPDLFRVKHQSITSMEINIDQLTEQMSSLQENESYLISQLASTPAIMIDLQEGRYKELEQLKLNLFNLRSKYSENYPDVKRTMDAIEEVEKEIERKNHIEKSRRTPPDNPAYIELASQLAGVQTNIKSVKRQIAKLDKKITDFKNQIAAIPNVEKQYTALTIDRDRTKAEYSDLMNKLMEARLAHDLEREQKGEHFTLIEPPRLPEKPYKPNRRAILLIGIIFGIGTGFTTIFLREFSDQSVHDTDDLLYSGLSPVLAGIPNIVTARDKNIRSLRRVISIVVIVITIFYGVIAFHEWILYINIFRAKVIELWLQLGF
ncbi:MAG: chain-length determining protein [bacterium]|nr:chain-length determining protein [bacterium]